MVGPRVEPAEAADHPCQALAGLHAHPKRPDAAIADGRQDVGQFRRPAAGGIAQHLFGAVRDQDDVARAHGHWRARGRHLDDAVPLHHQMEAQRPRLARHARRPGAAELGDEVEAAAQAQDPENVANDIHA